MQNTKTVKALVGENSKPEIWMKEMLLESREPGPKTLAFEHKFWLAHQEGKINSQTMGQTSVEVEVLVEIF